MITSDETVKMFGINTQQSFVHERVKEVDRGGDACVLALHCDYSVLSMFDVVELDGTQRGNILGDSGEIPNTGPINRYFALAGLADRDV
jgi:hypothetical protein